MQNVKRSQYRLSLVGMKETMLYRECVVRKIIKKEFDWAKRLLLPAGCSPHAHTGFLLLLWLHSPKTCMSAWLVNLNWLQERVCMVVSLVCLCVAPWWIGNLSEAYPASYSVTAGTGSSSLTPLKRIKRVQKMDGWMDVWLICNHFSCCQCELWNKRRWFLALFTCQYWYLRSIT